MMLLVSRTYDVVTSEPEQCEPSESGYLFRDEPMDLRSVIEGLETDNEVSSMPIRKPDDCRGTWTIQTGSADRNGDETTYHRHIRHLDGRPLTGHQLFRLYRAAGIIS